MPDSAGSARYPQTQIEVGDLGKQQACSCSEAFCHKNQYEYAKRLGAALMRQFEKVSLSACRMTQLLSTAANELIQLPSP